MVSCYEKKEKFFNHVDEKNDDGPLKDSLYHNSNLFKHYRKAGAI
jgi:hypothetical protein